ncbi:MAG: outer spore coat protein CotE [Bacilli bacterium]|nr:outer spore coat protein CotE [Bacilli bacterium]
MASYKEIVTKAVIGKGKKAFKNSYTMDVENNPTTVLGCWVINHKFKGYKSGSSIGVDGSYDVNIWYSYDNDSKTLVATKNITYNDLFNLKVNEDDNDSEIIVRALNQPNCSNVSIHDNKIDFDIEKELGVEIVGDKKLKIAVEDDEEPWQILDDEVSDDDLKDIDQSVNEDYL